MSASSLSSRLTRGLQMLYYKKPGPFGPGRPGERLPEAYKKFWNEWKIQKPQPVHYIPEPGKWKRNPETGEVTPVQNIPIPLKFPKESDEHIWGGEGVILGFQKRAKYQRRVPHFWVPRLKKTVVYSEILDQNMSVIITERTLDLIHQNYGFDHYILKTPACDLRSLLALKIKKKLLQELYKKSTESEDDIYCKFKQYLKNYTEEEIEWYGLTYCEAVQKLKRIEREADKPRPLKHQYRLDLIQELLDRNAGLSTSSDMVSQESDQSGSWLSKINPFSGRNP